jgi:methylated-DNA-[protein]-cysteine S-methyltransferase
MIFDTVWGAFGLVTRGRRLVATFLPRPAARLRRAIRESWPDAVEAKDLLPRFRKRVLDYFAGERTAFKVEVDLSDVPSFRCEVLEQCRRIPYGKTASYADLARAAGNPRAVRAVGGAMANNPLPLVIPCHRVIRSDGSLGGFSSYRETELKARLLRLEKVVVPMETAERTRVHRGKVGTRA